ncbi:MAG: YCF48-related protein, partial [Bacteroidota bacterium]
SGETWVSLPCGFPYDLGSVFFTGENNGSATGPLGSILHTSDGGTSWNPSTFSTLKDLWDCSFTNLQTGFACGSEGTILKTRDGGERWSVMTSGTSQTLNAICMVTDRVGYSAGEGGVVLKTDDAGETWNTLQAPAAVSWHDILFLDADKGFLVGVTPLIYHTTDGGHTWNSCNTGTTAAINAIGCYGLSGYACGTNATLLQTKDGGVTWQQVVVPELCEANLNKISCINENVCYVIGNQYIDNAYTMFLAFTRDGGNTWQTKTFAFYPSKVFTSLFFTDGMTGYAGGTGFIWKTTDGFDHWIDQTMDLRQIGPNDLFFISDQVGFSVSYAGQILKTTNGGGIGIKEPGLVSSSLFSRNYPNPFSGKTRISYSLPVSGMVQLVICDATGREVSTLTSQVQAAGSYYFDFDGSGMPSGFYFYRLFSKGETATGKMVKN